VDLHGEIGYLADHFGAEQLGRRRRDSAVFVGDPESCGVADERPPGQYSGLLVGEHRLHQLEVPDRSAALRRSGGVRDGFVEGALGGPDREGGDVHAPARQRDHRGPVADVFTAADQCGVGDADVVEAHVRRPCALLAHLGVLGADGDARGVGGYEKHRDARSVLVGWPGAGKDDEQVGRWGVGDEPLLAGDEPI
jgi:hypothetical protein